jgi:hypothetical protein
MAELIHLNSFVSRFDIRILYQPIELERLEASLNLVVTWSALHHPC